MMNNLEKISFAINNITVNDCNGNAKEDAIKSVRYLQEAHHELKTELKEK